jgi:formamidopyrimidine-DNA glycosylase
MIYACISMPELPEVEHLRRTLEPRLIGAEVVNVDLRRRDVLRAAGGKRRGNITPDVLLVATRITQLTRHGKNMSIVGETGRVVCVHLGMTGQLFLRSPTRSSEIARKGKGNHVHCIWQLRDLSGNKLQLVFRDPRRFGGLWAFDSQRSLCDQRLHELGPDALSISPSQLNEALSRTKRSIKAALLDQAMLAGVGNIYADEALFLAKIHPLSKSTSIPARQTEVLARSIQQVLIGAIEAGGSSIRDYIDGNGDAGEFTINHCVYGRGGEPCTQCEKLLRQTTIAQRTTVYCPACQKRFR